MRLTDEAWDAIDAALMELDHQLRADCDATFDHLIPDLDQPYRVVLLAELVKLDQEYRWKAGQRRLIEEYLEEWPELQEDTTMVAALLRSECQTRMYHGETIESQELEARFPQVCEQVGVETLLIGEAHQQTEVLSFDVSDACLESIRSGEWFEGPRSLPKPLAPGTMLGRYSVLSVLGRGGMATVYLAQDEELDRVVAIKVLHRQFWSQPEVDKNLLRRDARAAARLRHPAVVPVYDICTNDPKQPFIVMEYVKGESLQRRMARERLEVVEAIDIARQVADALAAAHRVELIHRDVKPGNILLDESGRVRVTDFGLAVHLHERDEWVGDCSGTLPYMAPEQISGQVSRQDGRTDIWALGVVLYEMLTGRRPFRGSDRESITRAIVDERAVPLRESNRQIPPRVAQLCMQCLEKDVEARNITAAELHKELEEAKLRLLRPSMVKRFAIASTLLVTLLVLLFISFRERPWKPPTGDVTKIPTHPWLADCKLVLVADTGAKLDIVELRNFVDVNYGELIQGGKLRYDTYYRDPIATSLRIERDWVLWEMPLALVWSQAYRDHHGTLNTRMSVIGPADVTLKVRYAVSADGVFQIGTVGDRAGEHLSVLASLEGMTNYRGFDKQVFGPNKIGEPRDFFTETNHRQNQLARWFGTAYGELHNNGVVGFGPSDYYELYSCPLEIRNYFSFPITVVTARLMHQQFDFEFAEQLRYLNETWNKTWSPIAEHPDQVADLSIAVNLRAPQGVPSALVLQASNDNGNESRFRVEGLAFSMSDQVILQSDPGEDVSHVQVFPDEGVCTGFARDVGGAFAWLYDEAPTRIELRSHSVESIVTSHWSYVCGGNVKVDSTEVSPTPGGNRKIRPQMWVLPSRKGK